MKVVQVFDPALCCSSGVCGVDVDQELVSFSADIDWAKHHGARIERFNLAQQPLAFAENARAKGFLDRAGQEALPLILVDGKEVLSGRYPTREELVTWLGMPEAPALCSDDVPESITTDSCCSPATATLSPAKSGCC
ncbi:MAG: arsenite efflux transporter metallochaperone ArsD [Gammaproteobacteria bacterium]